MTDDDPITRADLTRELHWMQTQVEQHGFPGTRAVLAELERLSKENARLRAALARIADDDCGTWDQAMRYAREVLDQGNP